MITPNHIRAWRFQDAPEELASLSTNGGDEDWLALIPPTLADEYIPWMEPNGPFGYYCVDTYQHPELPGYIVKIGSHS